MLFKPYENVEIVNCDYKKLNNRKAERNQQNEKIKKENRYLKIIEVVLIICLSVVVLAVTGVIMGFVWDAVQFNVESGPFFTQFKEIDPIWVKYLIEAVILLLGVSIYRICVSSIAFHINKKIKPLTPMSEQAHFATVVENNIIGNMNVSLVHSNIPYITQAVTFSFDAVPSTDEEFYYHFDSANGKWRAIFIPGLFKTVIDVGNLTIFFPYIDENQTVNTLEDAYIYEKVRRIELEGKLAALDAADLDTQQMVQLAKKEKQLMEEELLRAKENLQKEKSERFKLQSEFDKVKQLYLTEMEAAKAQKKENDEQVVNAERERENLRHRLEEANSTKCELEEKYSVLLKENLEQSEKLEKATNAEVAATALIEQIRKESNEEIQNVRAEYENQIQEKDKNHNDQIAELRADCDKQINNAKTECDKLLDEKQISFGNTLAEIEETHKKQLQAKDSAYQQLEQDHAAKIVEMNTAFDEERDVMKTQIQEVEAHLKATNDTLGEKNKENQSLLTTINQLEHNAKSDQVQYENLKEEHLKIRKKLSEVNALIEDYGKKEVLWSKSQNMIDAQMEEIKELQETCHVLGEQKRVLETQLREANQSAEKRNEDRQQLEAVYEQLDTSASQIKELEKQRTSFEQSNTDLRKRNKQLTEDLEAIKKQNEELSDSLKSSEKQNDEIANRVKELIQSCEDAKAVNERLTIDLLALQKEKTQARNYITSLESKLRKAYKNEERALDEARDAQAKKRNAEMALKREEESADFNRLMKEREEQVRKAREAAADGKSE